jgi:hypothetical protein
MSSPAPHLLLVTLLLVTGPGDRGGVEGGALTTPACIAACMMGPCAGAFPSVSIGKNILSPNSVADPGWLSRILIFYSSGIPDLGSRISDPGSQIPDLGSRISDLGSKNLNKRKGRKQICCYTFFCSHKFRKIENYFIFEMLKKKIFDKYYSTFVPLTIALLNLPKGKSLGRSKPAINS